MADIVISTNIDTFDVSSADDGISVGSKTVTLNTKDTYVPENIKVTVGASINVSAGSLNNAAATGVEYSENSEDTTIIPSGGYLYINKGWFENTKISLGHLIPEIASNDAGVGHILTGYKAYDESGNVLTGTIPTITPVFQGGTVSVTPSVNSLTVPTVTYNATGTFLPTGTGNVGSTYGVTTTAPSSGTDGTNYMTIDATHTASDGSVKAYATANRTDVTYKNAAVGYVNKAANTQALAAPTTAATGTSSASAIKPTVTDNFTKLYIPIVTVSGTGGGVSKATSGSSLSITGTAPTVTLTYSGKFSDTGSSGVGATYGVIEGVPSSGTDGTNYLSIVTNASSDTQTLTGSATIKYTRAAVTYTNSAGAIAAHNGSTLLGASSPSTGLSQSGTKDISASISGTKTYSIPIVSVSHSGGVISGSADGKEGTRAKTTTTNNFTGKTSTGTSVNAADYGFTQNDETDATNGYVTIYASTSSSATPTCNVTAKASTTAVTYTNAAGAIIAHNATEAVAAQSNVALTGRTVTLSSVNPTYTSGKRSFKAKIVEPKGTGGVVTVAATASISSVGDGGSTAPEVSIDYSGYINDHASDYGIVYAQPTGFVDGNNYSLLKVSNTNTDGSIVGSVSGSYSRTAVNADAVYQGVVNMSSSTQLLAAANNKPISGTFTTGSIGATVTGQKNFYIPIASIGSITGGGITLGTANVTGTGNISITPTTAFVSRSGATDGSAITLSTYGITSTAPAAGSGNWVKIDPGASAGEKKTVAVSVPITREAASITIGKGITTGATKTLNKDTSKTASGSGEVGTSIGAGTNYYVPVVAPTASVSSHTTSNGSASASEKAAFKIQGVGQTLPAGVQILTSAPSDLNTNPGGYIIVEPNVSVTNGSSSATGMAVINAGITTGTGTSGVTSVASTKTVTVTNGGATSKCYIKVWKADGGFTIS